MSTDTKPETKQFSAEIKNNIIINTISQLPQSQDEIPEEFYNVLSNEIADIIQGNIVENTYVHAKLPIRNEKERYANLFNDLNRLKNKLGGSPNYGSHEPVINDSDNNRFFFGIPMSAIKDWFRKTLTDNWQPVFFWTKIASYFGVTKDGLSQYEESHIRIQRFKLLLDNKEYFNEILDTHDEAKFCDLCTITGMTWHPQRNGHGVEKLYIEFLEHFLTEHYQFAKKKGDDALIEYFSAFDGICFEDRCKILEEFVMNHPLPENSKDASIINKVADWSEADKFEDVCMKEITLLASELARTPSTDEFFKHLSLKNIFDIQFNNDDGVKSKPTLMQFDSFANRAINYYYILEENNEQAKADEAQSRTMNPGL
jgi:hypothetical protein